MAIRDFFRRKEPAAQNPANDDTRPGRHMRAVARQVQRMFQAASYDRFTGDWKSIAYSADQLVTRHSRTLVARSRDVCANNDYGRAFLRLLRQNIVGPKGVILKAAFRGDDDKLDADTNKALKDAFERWGHRKNADVTGKKSWRALCLEAVTTAARDGDAFYRIIQGRDAGPWGFALQSIDPLRIPADYSRDDLAGGAFIRHGIEFNRYGRALAYHATVEDEREAEYSYGAYAYVRIPADEMIHLFDPDMVGQKRGFPWTTTAMFRIRHLGGMEDAAIINARIGASKMGFIQWAEGREPTDEMEEEYSTLEIDAEPGAFPVLPSGAEMKEWNPQYPAGEFQPFYKTMLRGISAGLGVAYNNFANDLEGVNFSSIRQGTLDEREHWKEKQEWLIEGFIQPVFEAWLRYSLLKGRITSKGRPLPAVLVDDYTAACAWQPRRWSWIDPSADVSAAVESKNNLLISPGEIIHEWGRDPSEVWAAYAADIKAMEAAGIPEKYILAAMNEKFIQPVNAEGSHPNS